MSDDPQEAAWSARLAEIRQPPTLLNAAACLAAANERTDFLVDRAIVARAINFLVGKSGSGKSWLAYDLALAVARGRSWLGIPQPARQGPVLVLNYDNPTGELGRRFKRLGMLPEDPIMFHSVEQGALRLPEAARDLGGLASMLIGGQPPRLILIDSFRQAHTADENNNAEMANVMGSCKALYAFGASVVIVHHTSKNPDAQGLDSVRGSSEIMASADAVIAVADEQSATWIKNRGWRFQKGEDAAIGFEVVDRPGKRTEVRGEGDTREPDPEASKEEQTADEPLELVRGWLAANAGALHSATRIARDLKISKERVLTALKLLDGEGL
jgi:hypothetical protein